MIPKMLRRVPALPAALLAAATSGAWVDVRQDGDAADWSQVRALVEERRALAEERRHLEAEDAEALAAVRSALERVSDDLALEAARAETQARERARLERERDGLGAALESARSRSEALAASAERLHATLEREVAAGLPAGRKERLHRLGVLREERSAGGELAARALVELCQFAAEDLRFGTTREEHNEGVLLPDGRVVNAYRLRLGWLQEYFVSEDGRDVGLFADGAWRTDLAPDERAAVVELLAIARGREAARLVVAPLSPQVRAVEGE